MLSSMLFEGCFFVHLGMQKSWGLKNSEEKDAWSCLDCNR